MVTTQHQAQLGTQLLFTLSLLFLPFWKDRLLTSPIYSLVLFQAGVWLPDILLGQLFSAALVHLSASPGNPALYRFIPYFPLSKVSESGELLLELRLRSLVCTSLPTCFRFNALLGTWLVLWSFWKKLGMPFACRARLPLPSGVRMWGPFPGLWSQCVCVRETDFSPFPPYMVPDVPLCKKWTGTP